MYSPNPGLPDPSIYTGDISYGTLWKPHQLRMMLEASTLLLYYWGQIVASPYNFPSEYQFSGPSVGGGGISFGTGAAESGLAQVIFAGGGGSSGIIQLENLRAVQGPSGANSLEWLNVQGPVARQPDFYDNDFPTQLSGCWSEAAGAFSAWGDQGPRGSRPAGLPGEMSL